MSPVALHFERSSLKTDLAISPGKVLLKTDKLRVCY